MKDPVNARVLLLKEKSGLDSQEFCAKCKIAVGTLWNIQNEGKISSKTIRSIASGMNASIEWIKTGKGKMQGESPINEKENPWKEALIIELKSEAEKWERQYREVWSTLSHIIERGGLGKLRVLNGTGRYTRSLSTGRA